MRVCRDEASQVLVMAKMCTLIRIHIHNLLIKKRAGVSHRSVSKDQAQVELKRNHYCKIREGTRNTAGYHEAPSVKGLLST